MLNTYGLDNVSKFHYEIIINEKNDKIIYASSKLNENIGKIRDYLYKKVKVADTKIVKDKYYYLILSEDNVIGWVNLSDSIVLLNKRDEPVKFKDSEMKNFLNMEALDNIAEEIDVRKVYMSKYYAIVNDEIYEAVFEKKRIVGVFSRLKLDHSVKINKTIDVTTVQNYYKDSSCNILVEKTPNAKKMKAIDCFVNQGVVRLANKTSRYWVKSEELNNINMKDYNYLNSDITTSNIKINHILTYYDENNLKAQKVIEKLVSENKKLLKIVKDVEEKSTSNYLNVQSDVYRTRYEKLKNSKLGKIQVAYWKYKNKKER